jgi:DNA-binding MarR family transcriptional regulator
MSSFSSQLERAKSESVLQLLFKAARLWNERALAVASKTSGITLRASHTAVFPHVDLEGTRLTVLASRLGISKQAVGQLVEELVGMGVLERTVDASDARARLVRFTARGRKALMQGLSILKTLEDDVERVIGAKDLGRLHQNLADMVARAEVHP